MKKIALLACLCLTLALAAFPVLAGETSAQPACPVSVEELAAKLASLEADQSFVELALPALDPMQGAVYKSIDSGICCSAGCPAVSGYVSFCGSASCPNGTTCLYRRK
ncbi:MAG TPA: hypothetical protein VJ725_07190 [Thermoanaerobaculia bacterium]|nr:hypothetical protein [Thermoanaerobaculia bacterium]